MIDIHCHTAGIDAGGSGCFVSQRLRRSFRYRFFLKAFDVTEQELLSEGNGLIIQRISQALARSQRVSAAVILAMDGVVSNDGELDTAQTEMYLPNEFVAGEVRRYPNLLFGASINPLRRDALRRLEQVADDGAVLLKWLPPIRHIDPADRRLVPFYLRLKELGLPLLSHTGSEHSFTRARNELGDPERLRLPLSLGGNGNRRPCGRQWPKSGRIQLRPSFPPARIPQFLRRYLGLDPAQPARPTATAATVSGVARPLCSTALTCRW